MNTTVPANAALSPLREFIENISKIKFRHEENRCIGVLDKVIFFPEKSREALEGAHAAFLKELQALGWDDVVRWIEASHTSYLQDMKELARVTENTQKLLGTHGRVVVGWNERLRELIEREQLDRLVGDRKVLCAFSSAVDATYRIGPTGWVSLVDHASVCVPAKAADLVKEAYEAYREDPSKDRNEVETVVEALAAIMYAYRNPKANLKPTLKPESEAENWIRQLFIDWRSRQFKTTGGGASLNIGDALGGLGIDSHVFWPYHSNFLAETMLTCSGTRGVLKRCWFDDSWIWKSSDFDEHGGVRDCTGFPHPVRLSVILSFSPDSQPINFPDTSDTIKAGDEARLIFQFKGHRTASFFEHSTVLSNNWTAPAVFGRWRWINENEVFETDEDQSVKAIRNASYHRVILSAFQRANTEDITRLSGQCAGLRIHHEISGAFENRKEVERYDKVLRSIYRLEEETLIRTAGMNDGELAAFTSWDHTTVFAAAPAKGKDSLLQTLLRARRVREVYKLDWLYVHGNDIDIAVVRPEFDKPRAEELRNAMLIAKVVVCAALHVRSGIENVPPLFEPSCSPKGFLAHYQFAVAFARQYAESERQRGEIQKEILLNGIWLGETGIPSVVVIPVYWPDPQQGCSMTGAGDISSGVTAALAR